MKKTTTTILVMSLIILTGCTKISTTQDNDICIISPDSNCNEIIENDTTIQEQITDMTDKNEVIEYTLNAFKTQNMEKLAKVISKQGVRFSPYSYIDLDKHIVLQKEELSGAFYGNVTYVRGSEDGTGDPIILSFKEYIKRYIYDLDFEQLAERNINTVLQRGNTINNIEDIYIGASTIEFFVPGVNPEYEGMDRRSLNFILLQENNERKLRGVVHSQWTI